MNATNHTLAWAALALYALYIGAAFLARTKLHKRRTGSTGFRGISGKPGTAEWFGGVLFVVALVAGAAAPILTLTDILQPIGDLDRWHAHLPASTLAIAGIALTLVAQGAMGTSWRIGVDTTEHTTLVTTGLFEIVRNPVFTAMILTATGLTLLVPNLLALLGLALLILAIELQVRVVEEPYLREAHGDAYQAYTARVGRFVPHIGKINNPEH